MFTRPIAAVAACILAVGASAPDRSGVLDAAMRRFVRFEIDRNGTGDWKPWCGGMILSGRDPHYGLKALTASHCLYELGGAEYARSSLRAKLPDGTTVSLDRAGLGRLPVTGGLAQREQAVVMDFAFVDLGSLQAGREPGVPPDLRPLALYPDMPVTVVSSFGVHACHVANPCGTQFDLQRCDAPIVKGVSGSPVWSSQNGRPVVIGLVTKHDPGGATSFTSVLAKNSFLMADPAFRDHDKARSDFVARFNGQRGYRLPRTDAPFCSRSAESRIDASVLGVRDEHMFVGTAFEPDGDVLSWDRHGHQLCTLSGPQLSGCQKLDLGLLGEKEVRGVRALGGGRYLVTFGLGGAAVIARDPATKTWTVLRRIDARWDAGSQAAAYSNLITHEVNGGFYASNGDLIIFGESALCVAEGERCRLAAFRTGDRREAEFTVRSAFEITPGRILAFGRDYPNEKTQCMEYGLDRAIWRAVRRCRRFEEDFGGLNAALPFRGGALAFSSSGRAVAIGPDLVGRTVPINGLIGTTLGAAKGLDDSIRDARWLVPDHIAAVVGSDGGFHMMLLRDRDGRPNLVTDRCFWRLDLGLWLMSIDVSGSKAAVVSQAGELYSLSLPASDAMDRFFASTYTGQCS